MASKDDKNPAAQKRCSTHPLPMILKCLPPLGAEEENRLFRQLASAKRTITLIEKKPAKRRSASESSQLGIARKVVAEYTDQISQANIPLVLKLAKRFILPGVELDDLIGDGVHKLLQCIDLFDVARGLRFSTYLYRALVFLYLRGRSAENETWRKRVDDPEDTVLENTESDEQDSEESDMLIELRTVLSTNAAKLTKLEKQIVLLSFEKTQAEISIITGCTKAKQKEHRDNAIEKLRKVMIAGYESATE